MLNLLISREKDQKRFDAAAVAPFTIDLDPPPHPSLEYGEWEIDVNNLEWTNLFQGCTNAVPFNIWNIL